MSPRRSHPTEVIPGNDLADVAEDDRFWELLIEGNIRPERRGKSGAKLQGQNYANVLPE